MALDRNVVSIFCDDIRQELGNKLTIVGCYGEILYVDSFPVTLARLGIFTRAVTSVTDSFSQGTIRAELNDVEIARIRLADAKTADEDPEVSALDNRNMTLVMLFSPLNISGPSTLKIIVDSEADDLIGGILLIRQKSQTPTALVQPDRQP